MSDITRYNTLEEQLERSEKLISTISEEIDILTQDQVVDTISLIDTTTVNYDTLITSMMQDAYRQKLLEPKAHVDHALREAYIHQLSSYKSKNRTTEKLSSVDSTILQKKEQLDIEKDRIDAITMQLDSLDEVLKSTLVNQQKTEEGLNQKVSERENLNNKIKQLMLNGQVTSATTYNSVNNIESKKGFLPWPVSDGKIELRYGEQKHPDNENLIYTNTGIDLSSKDNSASAVYAGTVLSVQNISSTNVTMILQHDDDFYTVYSNLSQAYKGKGEAVFQGDKLGKINNSTSQYVLHFEIWKGRENLNPYHWLKNN